MPTAGYAGAAVLRFLDNGSLDATYGSGGIGDVVVPSGATTANATAVAVAPDGSAFMAGQTPLSGGWSWLVAKYED